MRMFKISRFVSFVIACGLCMSGAFAQLNHFIYLQTDNQQPFYIKYNNRIISSSASGYLILPKLKDGVVEFALGFPKTNTEEQQFQCVIDKADKGFLVKNFNEKGWGLYDLQSSSVVYAQVKTAAETNTQTATAPPANDPFSNMLSKVTQDSTVKTVTVVKEPVETKPVVKPDTPKVTKPDVVAKTEQPAQTVKDTVAIVTVAPPAETKKEEVEKKEPVVAVPVTEPEWKAPAKSVVKQIRKFESREGTDYVFEIEAENASKDTVRLFIEKDTTQQQPVVAPVVTTPVQTEVKKDAVVAPPVVTQPQTKTEEVVVKKEEVSAPPVVEPTPKKETQALPNSNCKDFATEDDLIKLRRKMASQRKDEQMVDEAKKVFRNKCFTSAQLRNLSVAFLTDEGRYRFFDAALPYVTDFANFKSLGETIQDEYYKRRFMALLPNQ